MSEPLDDAILQPYATNRILFAERGLDDARRAIFHLYSVKPGTTACGRRWKTRASMRHSADEEIMVPMSRANGERHGRLCATCRKAEADAA